MRRQRVRACARGEDTPSSPVRLRYTPFRLMSFNFESRGRSRKGREAADLKEPSDGRNGNYCTALINAIRSTAAAAIDGRILLICRMRNGLALCARRLAIHFRWTGRKQRRRKSRPLHFAPSVLPFLDSFQFPSLSLSRLHVRGEKEGGESPPASDAWRRDPHRRRETVPVDYETCSVLQVFLALSLSLPSAAAAHLVSQLFNSNERRNLLLAFLRDLASL